jgi:V8-like Glu-specific endopeptidase
MLMVLTDEACGKKDILDTTFVVNQSPVVHWPWMASYGFINADQKWQHQCGATLVSDRHFLTTAHCVYKGVKEG